MLAFIFVLCVIGLCIAAALHLSSETTWFTYYVGGVTGLFISGLILEIWNKTKRKKELETQVYRK